MEAAALAWLRVCNTAAHRVAKQSVAISGGLTDIEKVRLRPIALVRAIIACGLAAHTLCAQTWTVQSSGVTASLRGISAPSREVVWASGTGGVYLRTVNAGAQWTAGNVPGAAELDFRAVRAIDRNTAWLMSAGPGVKSRLYKTADGGAHWKLLFTNPDATGFFDALAFRDTNRGAILGDPVDGHFVVLTTDDGGRTWKRRQTPAALPNEGAFAASNSCLWLRGKAEIWFATGGAQTARVFHSADGGETWRVAGTPLAAHAPGAGAFSLAFADTLHGVATGGDYTKPAAAEGNLALTSDGGRTWIAPSGARPAGYRSAVIYLAGRKLWIAAGASGTDFSRDQGKSWTPCGTASYNALAEAGGSVWAAGPEGRIGKLKFE